MRSADENVGGSVGACFVLFQVVDIYIVVGDGGREARAGRPEAGELVAFK